MKLINKPLKMIIFQQVVALVMPSMLLRIKVLYLFLKIYKNIIFQSRKRVMKLRKKLIKKPLKNEV